MCYVHKLIKETYIKRITTLNNGYIGYEYYEY